MSPRITWNRSLDLLPNTAGWTNEGVTVSFIGLTRSYRMNDQLPGWLWQRLNEIELRADWGQTTNYYNYLSVSVRSYRKTRWWMETNTATGAVGRSLDIAVSQFTCCDFSTLIMSILINWHFIREFKEQEDSKKWGITVVIWKESLESIRNYVAFHSFYFWLNLSHDHRIFNFVPLNYSS